MVQMKESTLSIARGCGDYSELRNRVGSTQNNWVLMLFSHSTPVMT